MNGLLPLSFSDIDAWNRLMDKRISSQDVGIIKQLDTVFLNHYQQTAKT
jgi:hypothetical protein